MTHEEYNKIDVLRSSDLGHLLRSPAHYKAHKAKPQESTPAMELGTLVHTAVLEPEKANFVVAPKCDRRTTEGKAIYAKFLEYAGGKQIITEEQKEMIDGIVASINAHPIASQLVKSTQHEQTFLWQTNGIDCKARPDMISEGQDSILIVDLKTTEYAYPDAFASSIAKYGYARQAAFYTLGAQSALGIKPTKFMFIAVEKTAPYAVAVYELDANSIIFASRQINYALHTLAKCNASGDFHGYDQECTTISLPEWAMV